jgi:hypothetical protein
MSRYASSAYNSIIIPLFFEGREYAFPEKEKNLTAQQNSHNIIHSSSMEECTICMLRLGYGKIGHCKPCAERQKTLNGVVPWVAHAACWKQWSAHCSAGVGTCLTCFVPIDPIWSVRRCGVRKHKNRRKLQKRRARDLLTRQTENVMDEKERRRHSVNLFMSEVIGVILVVLAIIISTAFFPRRVVCL